MGQFDGSLPVRINIEILEMNYFHSMPHHSRTPKYIGSEIFSQFLKQKIRFKSKLGRPYIFKSTEFKHLYDGVYCV